MSGLTSTEDAPTAKGFRSKISYAASAAASATKSTAKAAAASTRRRKKNSNLRPSKRQAKAKAPPELAAVDEGEDELASRSS
jgi:hypothetical protein